jgi:DNA-directed RNA polymerase subunit omega
LNDEYLTKACDVIEDREILINLVSRRAKELARGAHPMVNIDSTKRGNYLDIALLEVAEGKLSYEMLD